MKQKKGETNGVGGVFYAAAAAAVAFVVAGIIISFGTNVNTSLLTNSGFACNSGFTFNTTGNTCDNSTAHVAPTAAGNASVQVQTGLGTFASNMPTMASVGVAVLIIGLLIYGFSGLFKREGGM